MLNQVLLLRMVQRSSLFTVQKGIVVEVRVVCATPGVVSYWRISLSPAVPWMWASAGRTGWRPVVKTAAVPARVHANLIC